MNKWGNRSLGARATSHPDLQRLFDRVLQIHDCSWIYGMRNEEEQNKLYAEGKSKLQFPNSKHNSNPSIAADVVPFVKRHGVILGNKPGDLKYFYLFAGIVVGVASEMDIRVRWGGDWDGDTDLDDQTFNDLYHYELII